MAKVLRITVTQKGKVVEERIIRSHESITVGTDPKNTFRLLDEPGLPSSWSLFEAKGTQYSLAFGPEMTGRVSVGGKNVDFVSLKENKQAVQQGDRFTHGLNDASKGQVDLSKETTILFQFVEKPLSAAKPELPSDIKDGWMKRFEPILMMCFLGSFIVHTGAGIGVVSVDPPPPPSAEDLAKWVAKVAAPPPVEEEEPEPVEEEEKKDDKKKADKPAKKKEAPKEEKPAEKEAPKSRKDAAKAAKAAESKRQDVRNKLASKGLLAMIGAASADGDMANVFSDGAAIGGDLAASMEGMAGVGIAESGSGVARKGGGKGGGAAADIGDLGTSGGGKVKTKGGKKKTTVKGSFKAEDAIIEDGEIDAKAVKRVLKRKGKMFQQCYETALKSNSKLKGKIVIEFTINKRGKVSEASAVKDGVGGGVAKCVVSAMKRVRFPKPDDGEVTIANAFVFQPG
jgi:hypothetical protein